MKRLFFLVPVIAALLFNNCSNTIYVTNIQNAEVYNPNSFTYALPRTKLLVSLEVTRRTTKRGPYYEYADKYLGLKNVINNDKTEWFISDITIESLAEVDSSQIYLLQPPVDANYPTNYMRLTENGLLVSINENFSPEYEQEGEKKVYLQYPDKQEIYFTDLSSKRNFPKKRPAFTKYKRVKKDTTFVRVPLQEKIIVRKTLEEKAAEASHFIVRLRKRRFKLIAGIYDKFYEGTALASALDELERLEDEYLSLFIGKQFEETFHYTYTFLPDENNAGKSNLLCRFSNQRGIVPDNDLRGHPIMIQASKGRHYFSLAEYNNLPDKKNKRKKRQSGIIYRIPDKTNIAIYRNEELLLEQSIFIAQYGTLTSLPVELLTNTNYSVVFYPQYGALKQISRTNEAIKK